MSNPSGQAIAPQPRCGDCGAELPPGANYCWLCGAKQEVILATAVTEEPPKDERAQRWLLWLAVAVVAVVGFGVLRAQDPVIAVMYLAAVVPTILVVLVGSMSARARGQPWTLGKTAAVAATTAGTTILTAVVIALIATAVAVLV